jgi:elongation factor 1-alpha
MAQKPHMNLVFIGHVDHGKSTSVGRLLMDAGAIEAHIIEKYKKEAESKGKATFEFAWAMDGLKEERERGLTIDVAHRRFDTDKYYFTIIDAPGHRDFVKNMITGTSQADAAVLVVAAPEGVQTQTKEHIFLAKTLGITQLVVLINKMDATSPPFSQERFNALKAEVTTLLKNIGYKEEAFSFIPGSGYKGDNIVKPTANLGWWKGATLLKQIDNFKPPEKATSKALRLPIQDVYSITGVGTVPVGRVETGVLKPDTKIIFMPANKVGEVKSIEMHHENIAQAEPGDNVGFNCRGIAKNEVRRGDVAGPIDNPPSVAKTFEARIMVLNHPSVMTAGYTPVFHCHTAQVACIIEEIKQKLDPKTGGVLQEKPEFIKTGDAALIKVRPTKPMVIEPAKDFAQLGRFAIRDMGMTVAAGMCISVEKATMDKK